MDAPASRVRVARDLPIRGAADYVLYWMIAARRTRNNFALQHARAYATELGKPLLVLEALRVGHRWNTARVHRFVLDGMVVNAARLAARGVRHHVYVEDVPGAGRGLLAALAERACVVVTDEFPSYFLPHMVDAAAARIRARLEVVDGGGLVPLASTGRVFTTAASFRRAMHKRAEEWVDEFPDEDPLVGYDHGWAALPEGVERRWPSRRAEELTDAFIARLPLDHDVPAVVGSPGGSEAGTARMETFLKGGLDTYGERSRHPDGGGTSGLSPYLHFGHVGTHGILREVFEREGWHPGRIRQERLARREGFWGLSPGAEAFVDELVTWRELGLGYSFHRPRALETYDDLPDWAQRTLANHESDARPWVYDAAAFEAGATHEPLWNACQEQLRRKGVIHGYLRMLWAKMVLGWTASPREAFRTLVALNDRWSLDGRDPNGYSGVSWCFGRFDRAWGPERPVFGKVRYMTCDSTRRKLRLARWAAEYTVDRRATGSDPPSGPTRGARSHETNNAATRSSRHGPAPFVPLEPS